MGEKPLFTPEEIQQHIDNAMLPTEYNYWVDIEANMQDYGQPFCPKEIQDQLWNEQRIKNHRDNLSKLHGVFYKGKYFHYGQ